MTDLLYDPSSLCGPIDMRVVRFVEQYRRNPLDPSYLEHIQQWHGGIPGKAYFDAQNGQTYRIGRFLTFVDEKSSLEPPPRPSWEYRKQDIRIDWSVLTRIDQEPACFLVWGDRFLPFANLYWRGIHPDEMGLGEVSFDLLAFLYEGNARPRVVVVDAKRAGDEFRRFEKNLDAYRYEAATVAVADDFDMFLENLRVTPIAPA